MHSLLPDIRSFFDRRTAFLHPLVGLALLPTFACGQLTDVAWRSRWDASIPTSPYVLFEDDVNWDPPSVPTTALDSAHPTFPLGINPHRAVFDAGFQPFGAVPPFAQGFGGTAVFPFAATPRELGGLAMTRAVRGDDGTATGVFRPDAIVLALVGTHLFVRPVESAYSPSVVPGGTIHVSASGTDVQPIARLTIQDGSIGAELDVRDFGHLLLTNIGDFGTPITPQTPTGIRGRVDSAGAGEQLAVLSLVDYRTTGLFVPEPFVEDPPNVFAPVDTVPAALRIGLNGHGFLEMAGNSEIGGVRADGSATLDRLALGGDSTLGLGGGEFSSGDSDAVLRDFSSVLARSIGIGERSNTDGNRARVVVVDMSWLEAQEDLTVGRSMRGELVLERDGSLEEPRARTNYLGVGIDGSTDPYGRGDGEIDVRGGTLEARTGFDVGLRGTGLVQVGPGLIGDGATAYGFFRGFEGVIGTVDGARGTVDFRGGSMGVFDRFLDVGRAGQGTLLVGEAPYALPASPPTTSDLLGLNASVQIGSSSAPNPARLNVGTEASGVGLVVVRRGGSLTVGDGDSSTEDTALIGRQGVGWMRVIAGGRVTTETTFIGETNGALGEVVVAGQDGYLVDGLGELIRERSTWINTGSMIVGYQATGSGGVEGGRLVVLDTGVVESAQVIVASETGSTGAVDVIDATMSARALNVGRFGAGTLTVRWGDVIADRTFIGSRPSGSGTVTVGSNGRFDAGELSVSVEGGGTGTGFGSGRLVVQNGGLATAAEVRVGDRGTVRVEETGFLGATGDYTQDGGGRTELAAGGEIRANQFLFNDGFLLGTGTLTPTGIATPQIYIGPNVVVSPGFSFGRLDLGGSTDFRGTYAVEIGTGGPFSRDLIDVLGRIVLDSTSVLRVSTFGGAPSPGDSFTIATYTSGRTGEFGSFINLTGLDLAVFYGPTAGSGSIVLTVVPEPSATAAVLGAAAAVTLLVVRRRRA